MQEKKLTSVQSRLRSLAAAGNLKNADLARIAEVSGVAVGKWFGSDQTPKAEQLLKLARHFDVSIEWLLTGQDTSGAAHFSRHFDEASDDSLEDIMLSQPGPDIQKAVDVTRDTIRDLKERAVVFGKYAENLLIDAERMEDHLQDFIDGANLVTRLAGEAAKVYQNRKGQPKQAPKGTGGHG